VLLEQRELANAFHANRLQLVDFLASSAAVAVRNAGLVARVRADLGLVEAAEARTSASEASLRQLIESSPIGIEVFSGEGTRLNSNSRASAFYRVDARAIQRFQGHPCVANAAETMSALLRGEHVDLGQIEVASGDPAKSANKWIRSLAYATRGVSGELDPIILMEEDVSERTCVARMQSEFISTVSHELRAPLTSICGALGLLEGGVAGALGEVGRELVALASTNAQRLVHLVSDILDFERLEQGKLNPSPSALNFATFVEKAVELNRNYGTPRDVGLRVENVHVGRDCEVYADENRLNQVVANLLSNAFKFHRLVRKSSERCRQIPKR
jgi:signal transduction histidine kinase